ncbi:MAG: patatin-like phospholipase family protein [Bacteroidales bacterium]
MKNSTRIGLTLSGGAARGLAHLGVAKALFENGIHPDIISGTSSGAIVGAFLADGHDPEELRDIFIEKRIFEFVNLAMRKQGLMKAAGLRELIENHLKAKTFEQLQVPLFVAATNLNSGLIEYFSQGELMDVIIASSSIPVIFSPVKLNNALYADGGILDNFPIEPIKDKCDKLIGVHVNFAGQVDKIEGMKMITERSFRLTLGRGVSEQGMECDLFIEPKKLADYGLLELKNGEEMFDIGYRTTIKLLEDFSVDDN